MVSAQQGKQTKKKRAQSGDRRNIWLLVVMTLLVVGSVFMFMPPQEKINQGLDIQGGLSVVLTAKSDTGAAVSAEDMEKSRAIIESRVNALGASEATVQMQGADQVLVQIPGLSDTQQALDTIGKTGQLEFARLDSFTDEEVKTKIEKGEYAGEGTITDALGNSFPSGKQQYLAVEPGTYTPVVTGADITRVNIDKESETSSNYSVNIELNAAGTKAFAAASKDLVADHGKIVIILDNEVQSAPAVQSEIPDGKVAITGGYTIDEAKNLQTVLESGSLPVSFEYAQSQTVGPTLGQDALRSGVLVAGIGLLLVMLYLLFFYRGLGLLTAAAMAIFAVLYLGILGTLSHFGLFSLSLAGIAGIVLTIGMAADSSILTLERFREEIRMGRSVRAASITGVRHAIQTSIDADLVTLVSALTLFFLATASVKGFGLTLAIGIACDIVMMLLFKAPLIRLLAPGSIRKHPGFWGTKDSVAAAEEYKVLAAAEGESVAAAEVGEAISAQDSTQAAAANAGAQAASVASAAAHKPRGKFIKHDINFLGYRKVFLTIAAVLVLASFAVVGVKGMSFGIEFVGGTSVAFHGTGDITTNQMRTAFDEAGEPDAVIQTTNADGKAGFLIRTTTTSAEDATAAANKVADKIGLSTESFEVTTIGPDWGVSVIQSSLIAFLVSLVLIIIYIAIRFEYKMGVTAIVALLHDLVLVMGIYALFGREVNPNTIAALLTILGYSLYDTVVVFHRINDNMKETDIKCTFMTMANHSINQVLIRTINTTLSSLIPVAAMLFFGGATLQDFAFAMTIGLICGSYSSVAVATPLYAIWKSREPNNRKLIKKYGTEVGRFEFAHPSVSTPIIGGKKAAEATVSAAGNAAGAATRKPAGASAKQKQKTTYPYKRKKAQPQSGAAASEAGLKPEDKE
ncbi:MAG: protein translocase subunit SecD [Raoultibacter sp.]